MAGSSLKWLDPHLNGWIRVDPGGSWLGPGGSGWILAGSGRVRVDPGGSWLDPGWITLLVVTVGVTYTVRKVFIRAIFWTHFK